MPPLCEPDLQPPRSCSVGLLPMYPIEQQATANNDLRTQAMNENSDFNIIYSKLTVHYFTSSHISKLLLRKIDPCKNTERSTQNTFSFFFLIFPPFSNRHMVSFFLFFKKIPLPHKDLQMNFLFLELPSRQEVFKHYCWHSWEENLFSTLNSSEMAASTPQT